MSVQPASELRWSDTLSPAQADAVRALAASAASADGSSPLNDDALLHLQGVARRHLLAGEHPLGYAQLDPDGTAQLVVAPSARRRGVGRSLVHALLETAPQVQAWAFGDLPGAGALAAQLGATPVRTLLKMHRALVADPVTDDPPSAPGTVFRRYRPGVDTDALVELNALAFAHHPEQGRLTAADVAAREATAWFDPDGFILAEQGGRLVGYHWTKSHDATTGEVYVLGVHPDAEGHGLGRSLLDRGLSYLAGTGHTEVILYVEGDSARVVRLYRAAGFEVATRDVIYAMTPREPGAGWT